jgi:hypothetical protein
MVVEFKEQRRGGKDRGDDEQMTAFYTSSTHHIYDLVRRRKEIAGTHPIFR